MKSLTEREEEVMNLFWESGAFSIRNVATFHGKSKPSRTTVATLVKFPEQEGYPDHKVESTGFIYFPVIEREDHCGQNLKNITRWCSDNSVQNVANFLIRNEEYSGEGAKEIVLQISNRGKEWQ